MQGHTCLMVIFYIIWDLGVLEVSARGGKMPTNGGGGRGSTLHPWDIWKGLDFFLINVIIPLLELLFVSE